jgi:hypothetical protein
MLRAAVNQHPPVHHPLDDHYYSVVERIIQLCAGEHACGTSQNMQKIAIGNLNQI